MLGKRGLAVTSSIPGRTRLINFFRVRADASYHAQIINSSAIKSEGNNIKNFYVVDLAGYGFASAGKAVKHGFSDTIGEYLTRAKNIKLVFILLDIRHAPSNLDIMMLNFLQGNGLPFRVVATKCGKISASTRAGMVAKLALSLGIGKNDIIMTDSVAKIGRDVLLSAVDSVI
jgi:GTP-binding protein